jgi:hypothetical protein
MTSADRLPVSFSSITTRARMITLPRPVSYASRIPWIP